MSTGIGSLEAGLPPTHTHLRRTNLVSSFNKLVQVRLESEAHEKSDNCRGLSLLGQKCLLRQFHYRKDHGGRMYINRPMCARHACGQRGTWNDNARTVSSCAASLSSLLTPWDLRCSVAVAAEPIRVRLCCCCCCCLQALENITFYLGSASVEWRLEQELFHPLPTTPSCMKYHTRRNPPCVAASPTPLTTRMTCVLRPCTCFLHTRLAGLPRRERSSI